MASEAVVMSLPGPKSGHVAEATFTPRPRKPKAKGKKEGSADYLHLELGLQGLDEGATTGNAPF